MRSEAITLLSLFEWASIMGISPWEMAQVGTGFPIPKSSQCDRVFFQEPYQRDYLSREEVGQAIAEAEYLVAEQLGYWPAPKYVFDEHVTYPRPYERAHRGYGATWRGEWKAVQLRWGKFVGGGSFTRTLIGDTANLVLSDPDGDGVKELFTCSIATAVTDPDEIGVYYRTADRLNNAIGETWRIRPVNVSISGGTATITGHTALLVKPTLTIGTDTEVLDVSIATNFVEQVTVYRVYRDTTNTAANPAQGVAVWDVPEDCTTPDCQVQILNLCLQERLSETGQVYVSYGDYSTWPYAWEANRLQVNYLAGEPLVNNRMEPEHARIVARLATALLTSESCGCDRANRTLHFWRRLVNEGDSGRVYTQNEIDSNPYGEPRVGALWAWKRIQSLRLGQGVGI